MMDETTFTDRLLHAEPMLYRVSCALLREEADRRDALQETALKAWQHRASLREEQYFTTWLTRILINECHSLLRKSRRTVVTDRLPDVPAPQSTAAELRLVLNAMPEKHRLPLVLYYLEGFTVEEVAQTLHVPIGTAKYRLHQARKALRVELDGEEVTAHEGI